MDRYLKQLHADIAYATEHVPRPFVIPEEQSIWDWMPEEEERRTARKKTLEEWTGISKEAFPPDDQLTDEQVAMLFDAASKMLSEYNMHIVFILCDTPIRAQYRVMRTYWDQELPMLYYHMGFFEVCPDRDPTSECLLGDKCHCRFFAAAFADCEDEDLSPEEERARALDIEVRHIQKKYGSDWMKYYPYHLDPDYDDEYGNPYDYGFGDMDDDDEDDDWWKR